MFSHSCCPYYTEEEEEGLFWSLWFSQHLHQRLSLANAQEMLMEWSCDHSEVFNIGQCKQTSFPYFAVSPVTVHLVF